MVLRKLFDQSFSICINQLIQSDRFCPIVTPPANQVVKSKPHYPSCSVCEDELRNIFNHFCRWYIYLYTISHFWTWKYSLHSLCFVFDYQNGGQISAWLIGVYVVESQFTHLRNKPPNVNLKNCFSSLQFASNFIALVFSSSQTFIISSTHCFICFDPLECKSRRKLVPRSRIRYPKSLRMIISQISD